MDKEIKLTDEQLKALDKAIEELKDGKLTADELLSSFAPPPANNNNNHGNYVIGGFVATQVTITLTIGLVTVLANVLPEMSLSDVEDIKKEATLERLIEIRNAAIAKKK